MTYREFLKAFWEWFPDADSVPAEHQVKTWSESIPDGEMLVMMRDIADHLGRGEHGARTFFARVWRVANGPTTARDRAKAVAALAQQMATQTLVAEEDHRDHVHRIMAFLERHSNLGAVGMDAHLWSELAQLAESGLPPEED